MLISFYHILAIVGKGCQISNGCVVGPKCIVSENTILETGSVIFGHCNKKRIIPNTEAFIRQHELLQTKHLQYLVDVLPKYHNLKT